MRLGIKGLSELRERLASVRPEEILSRALAEQAERMAQAVRDGFDEPQGAGDHDKPWLRTGALHDSIEATSNGLEAAVGSNDKAAAPQEDGNRDDPAAAIPRAGRGDAGRSDRARGLRRDGGGAGKSTASGNCTRCYCDGG